MGKARGQYSKGKERREEILAAASDVLARDGYKKTSLGQIGRAIGLDSAHILYYFSSREDLLQEVLRRWDARHNALAERGVDAFDWWLESVRSNAANPGIVQLYTAFAAEAADENHPARAFFKDRFTALEEALASEIRVRQASGTIHPELDAGLTAAMLISLSDGLQVRWLVDRKLDMAATLRYAIQSISVTEHAG